MIDLFSFLHLADGESIERVYRSHPLRLAAHLFWAAVLFIIPWFFLFDYRGGAWLAVVACWIGALGIAWLAFDIWSSSLVVITTHRLFGAHRERFGRIRIDDWPRNTVSVEPRFEPMRVLPLGTLVWHRGETSVRLPWALFSGRGSSEQGTRSLRWKMLRKVWRASAEELARFAAHIDQGPHS